MKSYSTCQCGEHIELYCVYRYGILNENRNKMSKSSFLFSKSTRPYILMYISGRITGTITLWIFGILPMAAYNKKSLANYSPN